MKDILIEIDRLAEDELERANKVYPLFASDHEGYAVILEEIDEVAAETATAVNVKEMLWRAIRDNDTESAKEVAEVLRHYASLSAAELIQVVAMCDKFIESQEAREE